MNNVDALEKLAEAVPAEALTGRFKPYPAYKGTNLRYLPECPNHWKERKLKFITQIIVSNVDKHINPQQTKVRICNYNDVYKKGSISNADEFLVGTVSHSELGKFSLKNDDVIITKDSESWDDIAVPAHVNEIVNDLVCGYHLSIIRPSKSEVIGRFLYYSFLSGAFNHHFRVSSNGVTRFGLPYKAIKDALFFLPPIDEQVAIGAFLDQETGKIDALIAKKQRLIELLKEKRSALITHAVTKGLNPSAPMKPSGIDWLGDIPAHWDVWRTKHIAHLESGHTPSRQHPEYWENCTIPWFTLGDVWQLRDDKTEYISETTEKISEIGLANSSARLLPAGTVIVSRTASVGFSAIMSRPMATTQDFVNWVCTKRILAAFLLYVFRAMRPEFDRLIMGSTHQTIYMPHVRTFVTPVPPISEQERIIEHIRVGTAAIDKLIEKIDVHNEKLREYRSALITAAVTGKIDVRAATPDQSAIAAAS